MKTIVVGSRESALAVRQAEIVMNRISAEFPDVLLRHLTFKTTGDIVQDKSLDKIGGKGLFVKELDIALIEGKIDLAVHSLKDMPMDTPQELPIFAYSAREDGRDVLILPLGVTQLKKNAVVGCSSFRRSLQLKEQMPDVTISPIRGNIHTRLKKLDEGNYDAIVLALAGLKRMNLDNRANRIFEPAEMMPAAGQGILAVQGRAGELSEYRDCINDIEAESCALAERAFVRVLDGGCSSPVAAYAEIRDETLKLIGMYVNEETNHIRRGTIEGDPKNACALGKELALKLKAGDI